MSTEMIERVARAICGDNPKGWQHFEPEAHAAIKAMREPTNHMVIKSGLCFDPTGAEEAYETWRNMIDAALEDGDENRNPA